MGREAVDGTSENGQENPVGTSTGARTATSDRSADNGFDPEQWEALAKEIGLTPDKVREKLGHARKWEDRAKANREAADQVPQLQQQLDELRKAMADRDLKDLERAGHLAVTQVRSALAESGIRPADVEELLDVIEPTRLLKDGDPSEEAINRVVNALRKAAGRPAPDPDQGRKGGRVTDMNELFRRAVRGGN